MNTPPPTDTILFRVQAIEKDLQAAQGDIKDVQAQLKDYVPERENNLRLQHIQSAVSRIETDLQVAMGRLTDMSTKVVEMTNKLITQDAAQQSKQDNLQIAALRWILGIIVTVFVGFLVAYFSHMLR